MSPQNKKNEIIYNKYTHHTNKNDNNTHYWNRGHTKGSTGDLGNRQDGTPDGKCRTQPFQYKDFSQDDSKGLDITLSEKVKYKNKKQNDFLNFDEIYMKYFQSFTIFFITEAQQEKRR